MKLIKKNDKNFVAQCSYDERLIVKNAGFRWDAENRCWWTNDVKTAVKLAAYASDELRAEFQVLLNEKKKEIEASMASDVNIEIPKPEGLEYLPYQKAGIAYASVRKNALIADEMGLGKTIQAIGTCNLDPEAKNILIVCPSSLRLNWKREFEKWDTKSLSVGVVVKDEFPDTQVVIINYDVLKKFHDKIRSRDWDFLIADEGHYMKNGKAMRTQEVVGGKSVKPISAKRKLFLTGTPILNRPAELWTLVHALAPSQFSNWGTFVQRYANGHRTRFGWDVSGASNLEELQEKLRETIMVRRLKKDVLKELPAKRRQVIEITSNGATEALRKESMAYEAKKDAIEELKLAVELAKAEGIDEYTEAVKKLNAGTQAVFAEMSKLRHKIALAKVPYAIQHIEDSLENGKVIVFAHHKDAIEKIVEHFGNSCVSITGDTSIEKRQEAVDRFQTDDSVKLFVGNIQAAGVGLTLTASSHVIFVELDWVPGNIQQCEDRAHRIGQVNSVLIQHLVFEGSIDVKMANTLIEKQAIIEAATDSLEFSSDLPEKQMTSVPEGKEEKAATSSLTYAKIEREAKEISSEEIKSIHEALKTLSEFCDGANEKDGVGFNKFDSMLGHALAGSPTLSAKQAVLGRKLVIKYKKATSKW